MMNAKEPNAPVLALDLSMDKRHATHVRGDVTVILTWMQHNKRPCMVLIPTLRLMHFDVITPCIIPMDNAWAWAEETGDGAHAAINSWHFASNLGFNPGDPKVAFRLTSIIRDYLQDLLTMPPPPNFQQIVMAHATLTSEQSGKTTITEVSEDV